MGNKFELTGIFTNETDLDGAVRAIVDANPKLKSAQVLYQLREKDGTLP